MQMMRLDFVQRQKEWQAERERDAPQLPSDPLEDDNAVEYDLPTSSNAMQLFSQAATQEAMQDEEVDEMLQREQEELDALLSYAHSDPLEDGRSEHFYSDDDDYDALFSELMGQDSVQQSQQTPFLASQASVGEAMDTS